MRAEQEVFVADKADVKGQDKRNEVRQVCAEVVRVTCADDLGRISHDVASLNDAAWAGACVLVDRAIPTGATVIITCRGLEFISCVRHCTPHELGWLIGVEIDLGSRWDLELGLLGQLADPARVGANRTAGHSRTTPSDLNVTLSCLVLNSAITRRLQRSA